MHLSDQLPLRKPFFQIPFPLLRNIQRLIAGLHNIRIHGAWL